MTVRTLERSLGERRRFWRNFFITTAVSAVALGTVAAVAEDGTCNDQPFGCLGTGGAFVVGGIFGAVYSVPVGMVIGLAVRSERWEPAAWPGDSAAASSPASSPAGLARTSLVLSLTPVGGRGRGR